MPTPAPTTDELLDRVETGCALAADELLKQERQRLVAMVAVRMDRRLATRIDASDVVQDALAVAHRRLSAFARERPMPFYPWLRSIALERLIQMHREHLGAQRRSVKREQQSLPLPDESGHLLAERLAATTSGAPTHAIRMEMRQRVYDALEQLSATAKEVVVLRHLEELSFKDVAAVLGMTETAVYSRYRRAAEQLAKALKVASEDVP